MSFSFAISVFIAAYLFDFILYRGGSRRSFEAGLIKKDVPYLERVRGGIFGYTRFAIVGLMAALYIYSLLHDHIIFAVASVAGFILANILIFFLPFRP